MGGGGGACATTEQRAVNHYLTLFYLRGQSAPNDVQDHFHI